MPHEIPGGDDRNEHIEEMLESMLKEIKESFDLLKTDLMDHFEEYIEEVRARVIELQTRPDETQEIQENILNLQHDVEQVKNDTESLAALEERVEDLHLALPETDQKNDERMQDLKEAVGTLQSTVDSILRILRERGETGA